jgi:hypothetical protein
MGALLNAINNLPTYLFGLLMALIAIFGLCGVSFVCLLVVELFLPEHWKPAGLAKKIGERKIQDQIEEQQRRIAARKHEDELQQIAHAAAVDA